MESRIVSGMESGMTKRHQKNERTTEKKSEAEMLTVSSLLLISYAHSPLDLLTTRGVELAGLKHRIGHARFHLC